MSVQYLYYNNFITSSTTMFKWATVGEILLPSSNETCSIKYNLNNFMKNVATNEKYILRKMRLNFPSNKWNVYAK